jgi:hypothetical protein
VEDKMESDFDYADFLQRFASKVLWHFTGYGKTQLAAFDILKKIILEQTLRITEPPEDIIMPSGEKRWTYGYSCMCDIPFKDLRIHMLRYGHYGIAFNKNKAIKAGRFNPVLYIHKDQHLFKLADNLLQDLDRLTKPHKELEQTLLKFLGILGVYIKRGDLTAPINVTDQEVDKQQNNNFYYEREWRSAFEWKFVYADIEAIMVPKKYFVSSKFFLEKDCCFEDIPIIFSEMVERL